MVNDLQFQFFKLPSDSRIVSAFNEISYDTLFQYLRVVAKSWTGQRANAAQKFGNVLSRLMPGSLQSCFSNFYVCGIFLAESVLQKIEINIVIFGKCSKEMKCIACQSEHNILRSVIVWTWVIPSRQICGSVKLTQVILKIFRSDKRFGLQASWKWLGVTC